MRKYFNRKQETVSIRLLFSYLAIILAPAVAIIIIYINMQEALLNIQQEKSQSFSREAVISLNNEMEQVVNVAKYIEIRLLFIHCSENYAAYLGENTQK